MSVELETIIGFEVHIQLKTKSKMFCRCDNDSVGADPNINVCPICMGFVGTLPLINKKAFYDSVLTGLALGCDIPYHTKWDRKNYFYPDLPKAYQISQFDMPLAKGGKLSILLENREVKTIRINRLHLEEDAAKLVHTQKETLIDFNRAGTPLMEVVTDPDLRSPEEAVALVKELRRMVRYLDVSDADMEKGHLRCDASISLRPKGEEKLYPRTEIKNLNSFRMVEKALLYEIHKQTELWEKEDYNKEETTVLWNDELQKTTFMRDKEGAADYRYFPEPDIPEVDITDEEISELKAKIPILSTFRIERYLSLGFDYLNALYAVEDKKLSDFIDQLLLLGNGDTILTRLLVKWITGELFSFLKLQTVEATKIQPQDIFVLVKALNDGKLSRINAKNIFREACEKETDIEEELKKYSLGKSSNIDSIVQEVISSHLLVVEEFQKGKEKALNVLVGLVIKASKGGVAPQEVIEKLKGKIEGRI